MPIADALEIIRKTWPSNGDYLDDLEERLTRSNAIPLVPFVGAGLSAAMGFPEWGGFLTGLAAETAEAGLGATIFNRRVAHTYGERKAESCTLAGAVLALPELGDGAVVTTNFDRVLERVFRESGAEFDRVVWGSQVDSMRQAIADNRHFLLKIHGDAEEQSGRVLTRPEYEKHYGSADPGELGAQVGRIFQGRTLLFVGCPTRFWPTSRCRSTTWASG